MQIEFLGTGGSITIPKPGCHCRVCVEARHKGIPYSRTGPSIFVHGPNVLIDTPEEIKQQINRSRINHINACFYSHWHPDHVMGRRVWEMNMDVYHWPPQHHQTDIYVPKRVVYDLQRTLGTWEHLLYFDNMDLIRLIELTNDEPILLGNTTIQPFALAADYVYAFIFMEDDKRVLIVPDEMVGWTPPETAQSVDLAVVPMGLTELDLLTGERRLPHNHPALKTEAGFSQTLEIIKNLNAKTVIISHIEEFNGLSYDDLKTIERQLQDGGLNISFAYDSLVIDV